MAYKVCSCIKFNKEDRCLARYSPRAEANNALPCNTVRYNTIFMIALSQVWLRPKRLVIYQVRRIEIIFLGQFWAQKGHGRVLKRLFFRYPVMIVTVDFEAGHKKMIWAKKNVFGLKKSLFGLKKSLFGQSGPWNHGETAVFTLCWKAENGPTNCFFQKRTPQIR